MAPAPATTGELDEALSCSSAPPHAAQQGKVKDKGEMDIDCTEKLGCEESNDGLMAY
jgi:hypothetical protein